MSAWPPIGCRSIGLGIDDSTFVCGFANLASRFRWSESAGEHPDGDLDFGTTEATVSMAGTTLSMSGTWGFTGGTGKFANISGGGTFTDRQTSPTESAGSWKGNYTL